jgi:phenylalanyl-tRNA synthetase beta subunit
MAMCGFTEVLSFILCSLGDNFAMLNHEDDRSTAVIIENPRSSENEVCILNLLCFSYTLTLGFFFPIGNFIEGFEPCI